MLERLQSLDRQLLGVIRWAIIVLMSALVFVVFLQIVARYALSLSLSWTEEAARLIFICTIFLGSAVLVRFREHLTVTVFTDLAPPAVQRVSAALAAAVGLWCSYYLILGAWATLLREWDQLTPALQAPMGLIYVIILASTALMVLWLAVTLVDSVMRVVSGRSREEDAREIDVGGGGVDGAPDKVAGGDPGRPDDSRERSA